MKHLLLLLLVGLAACEDAGTPGVDGGVGRALVIPDPPGAQIGLHYGKSLDLLVRYVRDDATQTPIDGEPVHFAIFDDPVGSTLARDQVTTDDDGIASVTLTAGHQEGAFRIRASAAGADDVEIGVAISQLEFVEIDVTLTDPLPVPGTRTLRAALYQDQTCATITPSPKPTDATRVLKSPPAAQATLPFMNLLSRAYAIVGIVDTGDQLGAFGCVDLALPLVPPGAHLSLPIILYPEQPSVAGGYDLQTGIGTSRDARVDHRFDDLDVLDRCDGHLGQLLLDEIATRVSPMRASQIAMLRGTATASVAGSSTVSCRPAMAGAGASLDDQLGTLLATGAPGNTRPLLLGDLDAILAGATLKSHLDLVVTTAPLTDGDASPARYDLSHTAREVDFVLGSTTRTDDLAALGIPVVTASGVPAHAASGTLTIEQHSLPFGLPALWGDALSAMSIAVRLPALMDPTLGGWSTATVAAASRNSMTGCAAVEDLICQVTDPTGCAGTIVAACTAATAAVATRLDAAFVTDASLDLSGSATIDDTDGDLVGEALTIGRWTAASAIVGQLSFSGTRTP